MRAVRDAHGQEGVDPGETISDAVAHILTREPEWNALPADTPAHVRTLLRRCLQKEAQRRLPHIGLVRLELDEDHSSTTATVAEATVPRSMPQAFTGVLDWTEELKRLVPAN